MNLTIIAACAGLTPHAELYAAFEKALAELAFITGRPIAELREPLRRYVASQPSAPREVFSWPYLYYAEHGHLPWEPPTAP